MEYNATELQIHAYIIEIFIVSTIELPICLAGLVGNGIVICLLGFHIKRNPFTTYILNLSVADFGLLTVVVMKNIYLILNLLDRISFMYYLDVLHDSIFLFTFLTSQFLLTIISIDRCVCLFFPLWHRCHRPPRLSTVVCVIIWILSFLISSTNTILNVTFEYHSLYTFPFFTNVVIFMPIMCVSTVAMLIKVSSKPQQNKRGRLLRVILFTLVFFLLFAFPFNVIHSAVIFQNVQGYFFTYAYLCASLNSTINPMIYYLVGRDKRGRSSKRINIVLEKLFKEDEERTGTPQLRLG